MRTMPPLNSFVFGSALGYVNFLEKSTVLLESLGKDFDIAKTGQYRFSKKKPTP